MDVFGPTVGLQSRPQSIQERFRAHADDAMDQFAFWHDQNMSWLQTHLGDLQAQQQHKKSLAALMQSPAKKAGHKHNKATAAGLQSPFAIQASTGIKNIFNKPKSPSPDKENRSPTQTRGGSPSPASAAARSKRTHAAIQSPAKPSGQPQSPGKVNSPMHKKSKLFAGSPSHTAIKPPSALSSKPSPRAHVDTENVPPPSRERPQQQRVVSAASVNTSGDDEDAMVEASLLAASSASPQPRDPPSIQQSKLPTPASKVQNQSNVSRSTTPPFSPENEVTKIRSPIRFHIPSPRSQPKRAASPRTIPQSPSSKIMPPPASTKSSARSSPLKTAHRHMASLDSDDDEVLELVKPLSPRALPKPHSASSKTPASSTLPQPSSLKGASDKSTSSQQTLKQPKSTSSIKDKSAKRTSTNIPQSPVSAFLVSHQSRPSSLAFKGAALPRNNAAPTTASTDTGNTSLFAPQPAGHTSLHYTSKAFTSMSYHLTSKDKERDENLPSRVLPPSLFGKTNEPIKDSEVALKDESSSSKPVGRTRVDALMSKVESLTKSMGTRPSGVQRGDFSMADTSIFGSQSQSRPSTSHSTRPTHTFVRHESHDSQSHASTSFFSANDSQTSRFTDAFSQQQQVDSKRSSFAAAETAQDEDLMRFDETRLGTTPQSDRQMAEEKESPSPSPSAGGRITQSESTVTLKQPQIEPDDNPSVEVPEEHHTAEATAAESRTADDKDEEQQKSQQEDSINEDIDDGHDDGPESEADQSQSEDENEAEEEPENDLFHHVPEDSQDTSQATTTPVAPVDISQAATSEKQEVEARPSISHTKPTTSIPAPTPSLKLQASSTGLKSLQRAAAAREKEQQERDRKNAIKEEREQQRRLLTIAKQQEEERANKARAEAQAERKRKEPEEGSKMIKPPSSASKATTAPQTLKIKLPQPVASKAKTSTVKPSDDPMKRRKVDSDAGAGPSKPIIRIPAQTSRPGTALGKYPAASTSNAQVVRKVEPLQVAKPTAASVTKAKISSTTGKAPAPGSSTKPTGNKVPLHKNAGKLKAPQPVSTPAPPPPAIEEPEEVYEELPDIASEYSDSDDDTQAKKSAALPQWAQSPALKAQLIAQSRLDPDEIFGAVPELKLEDIFKGRKHQFRARSSSAHWSGPDALSRQEEVAYAKKMNFVSVHER